MYILPIFIDKNVDICYSINTASESEITNMDSIKNAIVVAQVMGHLEKEDQYLLPSLPSFATLLCGAVLDREGMLDFSLHRNGLTLSRIVSEGRVSVDFRNNGQMHIVIYGQYHGELAPAALINFDGSYAQIGVFSAECSAEAYSLIKQITACMPWLRKACEEQEPEKSRMGPFFD